MGLTKHQITLIKATIPILETGGETLIKHFYGSMLRDHPVVVPYFNMTHQASGDQPRALANAVLNYAKNIDRLQNLGPVASRIVNKHVSLAVRAEHYPIVGDCLLRAIREVLGKDVATDEVVSGWAAAYQQLADMLIAAEEKVYQAQETAVGGWRGDRTFIIARKELEADRIVSFYLEPEDGGKVMAYQPGSYTCVHVPDIEGQDVRRNYSLSQCHPGHDEARPHYRITVKRDDAGLVSQYLHSLDIGDRVNLLPPSGDFVYHPVEDETKPLLLIAGGVGITPIYSILTAALQTSSQRPITLVYCAPSISAQAFKGSIDQLAAQHPTQLRVIHWYSIDHGRRMQKDDLRDFMPQEDGVMSKKTDAYFVAPKAMMRELKHTLTEDFGLPADQVFFEFFGPAQNI